MSHRRRHALPLLLVLFAASLSFLYFIVVHRSFDLLTYPYKFPDSWSWLVESVHYLGAPVIPDVRAPGTPLTFAALIRLGWADLIPYRALLCHHLLAPTVYGLVSAATGSPWTAAAAAVLCLTNAAMLGNALYIGSDVAANLFLYLAVFTFWMSVRRQPAADSSRRGWLGLMALCLGVGALTQYAAFLLPIPFVLYLALRDRQRLADRRIWGGLVVGLIIGGGPFLIRVLELGSPLSPRVQHVQLVRFHLDSLGLYAWWMIGFFSLPVLLLAALGAWDIVCRPALRDFGALILLLVATLAAFFVFFYDWSDNRFLQYGAPAVFVLAALGLARVWRDLASSVSVGGAATAEPRPSRIPWQTIVFAAIAVVCGLAGSLSQSQPFSSEIVPWPGLAIDMRYRPDDPARTLHLDFTALRSWRRFNVFYYAHAGWLQRRRRRGEPIPCTFNDATKDLHRLATEIDARCGPNDAIALACGRPHERYVERNTLSFLTRRAVVDWDGPRTLAGEFGPRLAMAVTSDQGMEQELVLIPPPVKLEVITLRRGERLIQRMRLPGQIKAPSLLTGTFDQDGVTVHVELAASADPPKSLLASDLVLRNNDYTTLPADPGEFANGGEFRLTIENQRQSPAAFYYHPTHARDGWSLIRGDGQPLPGNLLLRARQRDPAWDSVFELIVQSGDRQLWKRRPGTTVDTTGPTTSP